MAPAPMQTRLDALTAAAVDAIVSGDAAGRITEWNPAAERMFGYRRDEIVGRPIELLMPPRFRAAHRAGVARVVGGEAGRMLGTTCELAALRKDGEEFPIELSLSQWEHDGARYFTGIIRDISDRKHVEREVRRYARELSSTLRHLETLFATVADLLEGQTLDGRYLLDRRLRSDDVGTLYEGTDLEQRAPVSVRIIRAPCRRDQALALEPGVYPHAAAVLDVGVACVGLPYVVVEPLSGESVADRIRRGTHIRPVDALGWCRAVAVALAAAHRRGDVHGRVCAETVFLQDADTPRATVKLLDFEVSRLVRAGSAIREAMNEALGPYRPPEVRGGAPVSAAADVFGLAMLLGELLTGTRPAEPGEAARREWIRAAVPGELGELAVRALDANPGARPGAEEFAWAVAAAEGGYSGLKGKLVDDGDRQRSA